MDIVRKVKKFLIVTGVAKESGLVNSLKNEYLCGVNTTIGAMFNFYTNILTDEEVQKMAMDLIGVVSQHKAALHTIAAEFGKLKSSALSDSTRDNLHKIVERLKDIAASVEAEMVKQDSEKSGEKTDETTPVKKDDLRWASMMGIRITKE